MDRVIMWFRQDLRLADNPALDFARQAEGVLPVFIWDPELPWGPQGAQRVWLHHSLLSLAEGLKDKGSRLIVRQGDTEKVPNLRPIPWCGTAVMNLQLLSVTRALRQVSKRRVSRLNRLMAVCCLNPGK